MIIWSKVEASTVISSNHVKKSKIIDILYLYPIATKNEDIAHKMKIKYV